MAAIVRIFVRSYLVPAEIETIKTIMLFCGIGLFASLLLVINGIDISAGFF